jgi:hypothetical protein
MTVSTDRSQFTIDQLDERIREREGAAALLPPGKVRQAIFLEITQLRAEVGLRRSSRLQQVPELPSLTKGSCMQVSSGRGD